MAATAATRRSLAWVFGLLPVLLVAAAGAGYWYLQADAPGRPTAETAPEVAGPPTLEPGHDYYVFARTIELYPTRSDGSEWDRIGGEAPDIGYEIVWHDQVVHPSPVRDDTLVAIWDPIRVDLREALMQGQIELASTLNQGAVINVDPDQPDATLTIVVTDHDALGLGNDRAGVVKLRLADLLIGDNRLQFEQTTDNAIKRIVLRTTDTNQPTQSLLEAISAP